METINFKMKEHEAEWKEQRRRIKNDTDYEVRQAQRECADKIEKAQRECADKIEKAQRKAAERYLAVSRDEDTYKHQARLAKDELRKSKLAELERIAELEGKEGGEQ